MLARVHTAVHARTCCIWIPSTRPSICCWRASKARCTSARQLGLGKPHRLLNALYARIERDPSRPLHLYTALSLDPPSGGKGLEARFLKPFVERHFGADFPRLAYVQALKRNALPAHIEVEEFYLQSGAMLESTQAQQRYASLNYTHVARALADRGLNVIVQKVARSADGRRLSLSCNTDLTFDALDAIAARGLPRPLLIAEIDPELPWLGGSAAVDADFFDAVVTPPGPYPKLFGLPRQPVTDTDYAIGFHASTFVRDGGTLQIGIGALADALCHALALRHTDNAAYRRVLRALNSAHADDPALGPFAQGLYGCSEMLNEGFRRLVDVGVIKRKVLDDAGTDAARGRRQRQRRRSRPAAARRRVPARRVLSGLLRALSVAARSARRHPPRHCHEARRARSTSSTVATKRWNACSVARRASSIPA